jgi:CHAD domain-containing protein
MHGFLEAQMGEKAGLRPNAAIGPALRGIAEKIVGKAGAAIGDPARSNEDAVHDFRRAMKEWRALMRLIAPFAHDARQWRIAARDHARALAHARDGSAALHAFDHLLDKDLVLSARTDATVRGRLEALRGSEETAALTPGQRDAIVGWLDGAAASVAQWPLDAIDFSAIAARLTLGYRSARKHMPKDWTLASGEDLHALRRRVVDHRYQMALIGPLWPRFGRMWTGEAERLRDRLGRYQDLEVLRRLTGPHQPLAPWRSRLAPVCAERSAALAQRAARIAQRLFAERPKTFRARLEALWEQERS